MLINLIPIKLIGGILLMGSMLFNSTLIDFNKKINEKHEQVKEELIDLIDDYESCEDRYINNLIENGEIEDELNQETLNEFKGEFLSIYVREIDYRGLDISERTIEYMRKELSKSRNYYESVSKISGESYVKRIIYDWMSKFKHIPVSDKEPI